MKDLFLKVSFVFIFFSLKTEGGVSQNIFRATVASGLNFSQIDGDFQQGYKRKDLNLGLIGDIVVKPNIDFSLELFYNPRGTTPSKYGSQDSKLYTAIQLKYADVNTMFNYHYTPNKSKTHYIQTLKVGLGYGRLLKSKFSIKQNTFSLDDYEQFLLNNIKKDDFTLILGAAWHLTPRLGIMVRHTSSLNTIFDKRKIDIAQLPANSEKDFKYLRPYFLSFNLIYHIISPHKIVGIRKNVTGGGGDPLEEL
jgi:hypothetical protein